MRFLRNFPIGLKVTVSASVLCALLLAASSLAVLRLIEVAHRVSTIGLAEIRWRDDVDRLASRIANTHQELSRFVIWSADQQTPEDLEKQSKEVTASIGNVNEALNQLGQTVRDSDTESRLLSDIKSRWEQYSRSAANVIALATVDPTIGTMMLDGSDDEFRAIDARTSALIAHAQKTAVAGLQSQVDDAWATIREELASDLLIVVLGTLTTVFVIRSIAKPIKSITRAMSHVSMGVADNLTEHVGRADEIGQMARAISAFQTALAADQMALLEQNVRFKAVVSNIPHGLALYDQAGRLIIDNQQHAKLYARRGWNVGSSHTDVLRSKLQSQIYVDPDRVLSEVTDVLNSEFDTDISVELKDGRTIAVSYSHIHGGGWVETHKDATARRRAEAKIQYIAYHDVLTDFPNRRAFDERLSEELRPVSPEKRIAIHLLDLNGFKKVNDQFGHAAGDDLLVHVARRLRECIGEADFCARLGGDEFVIIQSDVPSYADAENFAADIIRNVGQPYDHDSGKLCVEISDGVAFAPEHGTEFDVLMRNADIALYLAKKETRGTCRLFDDSMYEQSLRRRRLEEKLRESFEIGALSISYQPIFNAATRTVSGFEALCRWNDAEDGEISPSQFIPIAEETGLITRLGKLVLNRACLVAATWPSHLKIAVNVSPVQFRSDNLVNDIREALTESGLAPSRLEIEVTETSLLSATREIHDVLQEIRSLGVRIVIDDFGTGCTGLSYLTSFRFDKLKIDRKFVRELHEKPDRRAIVKAIVRLCREVGIATVGEGVETAEEFQSLLKTGCTEVQGYLFSPALRADQLQQFFDNGYAAWTAALDRVAA